MSPVSSSSTATARAPTDTAKTILVTGATGRQGFGVITALLSSPQSQSYTIVALTRDPTSPAAQHLATLSPRILLLRGDLNGDIPSIFSSASRLSPSRRVWGVYSVQVSTGRGVTAASEVRQGCGLVDAALAHGASVFVYSSVERGGDDASWDNETPVAHFRTKHAIEHHLRRRADTAAAPGAIIPYTTVGEDEPRAGVVGPGPHRRDVVPMRWTVLRPVAFMDNLSPTLETDVFLAALRNNLPADKKVQWVASSDVGAYAAMAFDRPDEWDGRAVGLAGDELTMDELSGVFERVVGRPARGTYWLLGSVLTALVREMGLMIGWFATDGYRADIAARRREYPGLLDLEGYLRSNGKWQDVAVR